MPKKKKDPKPPAGKAKGKAKAKPPAKKKRAADDVEGPNPKRSKTKSAQASKKSRQATLADSGNEWDETGQPLPQKSRLVRQPDHDIFPEDDEIQVAPTPRRSSRGKGAAKVPARVSSSSRPAAQLRLPAQVPDMGSPSFPQSQPPFPRPAVRRPTEVLRADYSEDDGSDEDVIESPDEEEEEEEEGSGPPVSEEEGEGSGETTEEGGTGLSKAQRDSLFLDPDVAMPADSAGEAKLRLKQRTKMRIDTHCANPWILCVVRFLLFFPCFCVCMLVFMCFLQSKDKTTPLVLLLVDSLDEGVDTHWQSAEYYELRSSSTVEVVPIKEPGQPAWCVHLCLSLAFERHSTTLTSPLRVRMHPTGGMKNNLGSP